ncbi:Aste57867_2216 [Aphanomyces stellatus]|uniref:Aste57867_2216 protein n=1 Tax=Aphanomyces stellatus TaxID=120398 RepID=A0A485KC87_9STRA|nr:hypothetical protein As57867_002211 [Aphanomyces stellatus]VFT79419.1 Aste57867_2216 [Aphanomyces stellatus]
MRKVYVQRVPSRVPPPLRHSVSFCPYSLVYSVGYVLNLVLIPFKAYLSEPFPWQLQPLSSLNLNLDAPFDVFSNTTVTYFATKYNQESVPPDVVFTKDRDANTYLVRFLLALPPAGDARCVDYLHYFPGADFFSKGMTTFVCDYVGQNASSRLSDQSYECQQIAFLGVRVAVSCTWVDVSPFDANEYFVFHAAQLLEAPWVSWVNFGLRCGLFGYIARAMWYMYYRHYGPLLHNLRTLGLPNSRDSHGYEVQLGDPSWLILSHPFVSLFMLLDCIANALYGGAANSRTSQVSDIGEFCLGCLYGSRTVWAAYMLMRYATSWIHRKQWEQYFEPVDSSFLALTASFYAGPLMYLFSRTQVMWIYQWLQALLIPEAQRQHGVESSPLMLMFLVVMASVPLVVSFVNRTIHHHRKSHIRSKDPTGTLDEFASKHYSDWKQWFLFRWLRGHDGATKEGGTLYHLFDTNPRYRKFPLFSTRGSDCFVYCVDAATSSIVRQVRLSLIHALDRQTTCTSLAIPICPSDHPTCAVSMLDASVCSQASPSGKCLHLGANDCQWMK